MYAVSWATVALFIANFLVVGFMLVAVSYGTYRLIEVPFRKTIRAIGRRVVFGKLKSMVAE